VIKVRYQLGEIVILIEFLDSIAPIRIDEVMSNAEKISLRVLAEFR
jgi:hypothetical protein